MYCPKCEYEKTKTTGIDNGYAPERARRCPACGFSWMTIETVKYDEEWKKAAQLSKLEADDRRIDHRTKDIFNPGEQS